MSAIYDLYWHYFQSSFFFASFAMTLSVASNLIPRPNTLSFATFISWLTNLFFLVAQCFATIFAGILFDELNIVPTDWFILALFGYSVLLFSGQSFYLIQLLYKKGQVSKQMVQERLL